MIPPEPASKAKLYTQDPPALRVGRKLAISLLALCGLSMIPHSQAAGNNWMGPIDDSMPLSRITIPGTHNSGARFEPFPATAKCQTHTIAEQLNYGVRFLDIRCRHIGDRFAIHHGPIYQESFFGEVLTQVYDFLNANPSECVLMSVKEEHSSEEITRSFEATFNWYHSLNPSKWALGTQIPKLGDVRGKIVLVRRFGALNAKGINASYWPDNRNFQTGSIDVQDNYQVDDNDTKWSQISTAFSTASNQVRTDILHLNFCSGYHTFLGVPNITSVSNSINRRLDNYFASAAPGHYGCMIMDFATAARSAAIYNANLPAPLAEDVYRIVNRNSGKVLEIPVGNTANGVRATQGDWTGANHQRWKIKHLGAGNYRITALHSGKALDLAGSSADNAAQLVQWSDTGGANQQWHLLSNGDGSHRLLNLSSGKALEITAGATNDGALTQQWSWENLNHQKWIIEPANQAPAFKKSIQRRECTQRLRLPSLACWHNCRS